MKSSTHQIWSMTILIILFSGNIFAQLSGADKLRHIISKETNDTTRIKLLIQLGLSYPETDPEQDKYLQEAYDLSKKTNFRYGLAYGEYYEGILLLRSGRYEEALYKYKSSINRLDSLRIVQSINGPLSTIRFVFNLAGKQPEKFRYYSEKIVFYKRHGLYENTANCFHGIAGYYHSLANYDKAIEYYLRARDVFRSFDSLGYANEQQVVGSVYLEWGNLDKAELYLKSALKDLIRLNEVNNYFFCYHKLGDLYFIRHDYNQALQYYMKGKEYATTPPYQAINLINCAAVYLRLESKDSARFYLDNAEKIRQKEKLGIFFSQGNLEIDYTYYQYYVAIGNQKIALKYLEATLHEALSAKYIPLVLKYTDELHSFLINNGDSLQALRYLVQYHTIQDSMNTMNAKARIATFEIEQQQKKTENEIEQLQAEKVKQRNYYLVTGTLLLLIVISVVSIIVYKRRRDKELLTADFKKQLAQAETKALRSQMNPHFIFNSLNSINNFVTDQKHEIASDYLLKFSKLIRLILDNSRSETIPLDKELETLQLYVQLESIRFENHFKYVVNIAENTSTGSIMIPPMLLQPFIENAIWHGLMQKRTKGTITVDIRKENEKFLNISITDDGIGREKAAEMKSKSATHRSHGMKVTSERIEMMNKLNSTGAKVHIIDLKDEQGNALGTRVELTLPI